MDLGTALKQQYFACSVNQSLLELAVKLREAEVRVNGQTVQPAVPPRSIAAGISSTIDGGRFQFIARGNFLVENFASSEYINSSGPITDMGRIAMVMARKRLRETEPANSVQEEIEALPVNTHPKKLPVPNREGPSLWPFLSSVKTSIDCEHVKFLEKNQHFYSNYNGLGVAEDYVEPLSSGDFKIIIDNAVDALLKKHESRAVSHQLSVLPALPSQIETSVPAPAPVSIAPMPVTTVINFTSTVETDQVPSMPTQPAVIPKRYAAAAANPRRFRCGLCPYSTNNRSHVRRHHISVHSDARPFRCYVCGKEFARCENAKVHMISQHPEISCNVDRLRNDMFFDKDDNGLPPNLTNVDSAPSTSTQSSDVSCPPTELQLQQNVGSSETSAQWQDGSLEVELQRGREIYAQWQDGALDVELKRARLEHNQPISSWLNFPPIKPRLQQNPSMFCHGTMGNQFLEGIPQGMFQAQASTVMNVQSALGSSIKQEVGGSSADADNAGMQIKIQSVFGSVPPIKQELSSVADTNTMMNIQSVFGSVNPIKQEVGLSSNANTNPVSDHPSVCLYCQAVCPNAAELAKHIATSHTTLNSALHAAPGPNNPGYVVLQTAAPIFLFPYGSDAMLPNRGLGYQPILPKLPAFSEEGSSQNEASAEPCSSSATTPQNAPRAEGVQKSQSASTPSSLECKRERKRQFKTFYCSRCPDRAPFRYEKSFEKHLRQHRIESRSHKAQKIMSKVT